MPDNDAPLWVLLVLLALIWALGSTLLALWLFQKPCDYEEDDDDYP